MAANTKLTVFDCRDHGSPSGSAIHISADPVNDPETRDPQPCCEIFVALTDRSLTGPKGEVFVRPGMQASAELDAGRHTVFTSLFHPILDARESVVEPD